MRSEKKWEVRVTAQKTSEHHRSLRGARATRHRKTVKRGYPSGRARVKNEVNIFLYVLRYESNVTSGPKYALGIQWEEVSTAGNRRIHDCRMKRSIKRRVKYLVEI